MALRWMWLKDLLGGWRRRPNARERILKVLVTADEAIYGLDIAVQAQVGAGQLYPLLDKLQRDGLVVAGWEPPEPPGRWRKRVYRITDTGMLEASVTVQ